MMKRAIVGLSAMALGVSVIATPASAQGLSSKGDEFLAALRESNGGKAIGLVENAGSNIINHRADDGSTALHIVIRNRDSNWVGYLLAAGADPNAADKKGETPLILAARSGYGEGAALLLRDRAEVDKGNRLGETPLIVAVQQRHSAIVSTLLKLGANPDKRDYAAGFSARDYAKRDSRTRDMLKLIETVKSQVPAIARPAG